MACALDGDGKAALVLEAGAGNAAGQNLALLIDKLQEEIGVFVVDVLDPVLLEAAVLFRFGLRPNLIDRGRPNDRFFHLGDGLGVQFSFFAQTKSLLAALFVERQGVLVQRHGQKPDDLFVIAVGLLEFLDQLPRCAELHVGVVSAAVASNGVCQLADAPMLDVVDFSGVLLNQPDKFVNCLLVFTLGQIGIEDERGFVLLLE